MQDSEKAVSTQTPTGLYKGKSITAGKNWSERTVPLFKKMIEVQSYCDKSK